MRKDLLLKTHHGVTMQLTTNCVSAFMPPHVSSLRTSHAVIIKNLRENSITSTLCDLAYTTMDTAAITGAFLGHMLNLSAPCVFIGGLPCPYITSSKPHAGPQNLFLYNRNLHQQPPHRPYAGPSEIPGQVALLALAKALEGQRGHRPVK